ncbi:hypothetical protein Q8F55_003141 [Vanrija albida]|uniref:6-phosphogluconate dehydrogenase NADP-binding domain-containing protein n=1 Tax=Vanrija albida TaxID=181172 RepID=A0ABR3QBR0_9TREE
MDNIPALAATHDIVEASEARRAELLELAMSHRPVLLLGDHSASYDLIQQAVGCLSNLGGGREVLLVVPLGSAEDGTVTGSRAVCSGVLHPAAKELLVDIVGGGVVYLGPEPMAAAKYRLVENGLVATQTAIAAEAVALGSTMDVPPELFLRAIGGAAGSSWSFKALGPRMLSVSDDGPKGQAFDEAVQALNDVLDVARDTGVYAPQSALALQTYVAASKVVAPHETSAQVALLWNQPRGTGVEDVSVVVAPGPVSKVGFIGLGAMGLGMANVLRNAGIKTVGHDVYPPSMEKFAAQGGEVAPNAVLCAEDAEVLVLMVMSAEQAHEILFIQQAAAALAPNASVLLMITASPSSVAGLAETLARVRPDARLLDAPVSGGSTRAADGDLTILCAGIDAFEGKEEHGGPAVAVLSALSSAQGNTDNLVFVPGEAGKGAALKVLNQHLAGPCITASAEYLALARRLGLPLLLTRDLLLSGPAWSFIMHHRGANMLNGLLQPPTAMISIWPKDLGIVVDEARKRGSAAPMASHAHQQFILGKANGWGADDDASIVRLWRAQGIEVTVGDDE